ncbi:Wall-associated receptor kinase, C-terminal [Dillenia turbinata]|uniref:Wall-associated receptor kinase, C-terminal n=1 Tax=Dillenia turbinata TaxID=194707 RepID=A0AAN8Z1L5_9MAGN
MYRSYNPQCIVSHDVIFDEISFYNSRDYNAKNEDIIISNHSQNEDKFASSFSCFFANLIDVDTPSSYEEVKGVKEWEARMKEEMDALYKTETWDLTFGPTGVDPVSYKSVYYIKWKVVGSINCFKAKLVDIIMGHDVMIYDWLRSCEQHVVATVMENQITNHVNYTVDAAMKNGFVLNWTKLNDCVKCE